MVIFYSKRGQLANRLWQSAYFVANAIEHNYTLFHLGFADYSAFFSENLVKSEKYGKCFIIDLERTSLKNRIKLEIISILKFINKKIKNRIPITQEINFLEYGNKFDISENSFLKLATKKILFVEGWLYIDRKSLLNQSEIIRNIFRPNEIHIINVQNHLSEVFQKYEVLVGVHLRKGDYAKYQNGIWFYSNSEYKSFLKQITELLTFKNKKIAFLLCSNEHIELKDFAGFDTFLSTNHFIEDLYALSVCDFIIGPPSTYSSWASFYGNTPLLHLKTADTIIKETDFKTFKGY